MSMNLTTTTYIEIRLITTVIDFYLFLPIPIVKYSFKRH